MEPIGFRWGISSSGAIVEFFRKGEPWIWPLLVCFIVIAVFVLERIWVYWWIRGETETRKIVQTVTERLATGGSSHDLAVYCDTIGRLEGYVFAASLECYRHLAREDRPIDEMRQELFAAADRATSRYLERYLPVIGLFAQMAIFLGLLGTVSGMIRSFGAITRSGIGETAIVTAGISEALMTTAMGCVIAVPALITYVHVANRAERKFFQFESYSHTFVDMLLRQRKKMV